MARVGVGHGRGAGAGVRECSQLISKQLLFLFPSGLHSQTGILVGVTESQSHPAQVQAPGPVLLCPPLPTPRRSYKGLSSSALLTGGCKEQGGPWTSSAFSGW